MIELFAHSSPGAPKTAWEPLTAHLEAVGLKAAGFARSFGFAEAAEIAGRLHDIGKASAAFQRYIGIETGSDEVGPRRVDHSTAGAREVCRRYPGPLGRMLAFAIAGHHAGLADAPDLDRRLDPAQTKIEPYVGWEPHAGPLPERLGMVRSFQPGPYRGFSTAFL